MNVNIAEHLNVRFKIQDRSSPVSPFESDGRAGAFCPRTRALPLDGVPRSGSAVTVSFPWIPRGEGAARNVKISGTFYPIASKMTRPLARCRAQTESQIRPYVPSVP